MSSMFDTLGRLNQGGLQFKARYEEMKAQSDANFEARHPIIKRSMDFIVGTNSEIADRAGAPGWAVKATSPGIVFPWTAYAAGVVNEGVKMMKGQ